MRKSVFAAIAAGAALSVVVASPASAAYTGPSSWDTPGLKSVIVETGQYSWSIDGLGTLDGTGNIQAQKPTGGTVYRAYFVAAQVLDGSQPTLNEASNIELNGLPVTFQYESLDAGGPDAGNGFNNYFADVTSLVSSTINGQPAGVVDIAVDEGGLDVEGTALVVLFNDSNVDVATVVLAFGNSSPDGDSFTLAFDALTTPQTQDLQMSVGISYSYDRDGNSRVDWQSSTIVVNDVLMTDMAGSDDDCDEPDHANDCGDDALVTVGGVGDNTTNPTMPSADTWSQAADDELYSLTPFVEVGDTSINVETSNPSSDDNIFLDAFYLKHVSATLTGGDDLADTGFDLSASALGWFAVLGAGVATVVAVRRRKA
jgi:hypothetical protein